MFQHWNGECNFLIAAQDAHLQWPVESVAVERRRQTGQSDAGPVVNCQHDVADLEPGSCRGTIWRHIRNDCSPTALQAQAGCQLRSNVLYARANLGAMYMTIFTQAAVIEAYDRG